MKITEEEAGSSMSIYLTNHTKNTTILYAGNPDSLTEPVMKVNYVWFSIHYLPGITGLAHTHRNKIWRIFICNNWWTISNVLQFPSSHCFLSEVFGGPGMSQMPQHATHPDEPGRYPERFQEPTPPRDYPPPAREFFDSHSPAPPLHMGRGPRMNRGPRYSNNLDKITSTLLELVARK